jgi:DNA-binding NtrC family response regulator
LRERGDDVVLLAEHLLARACADYRLTPKTFTSEALATLRAYRWPGNIRELSNVVERVALLSDAPSVTAEAIGLDVPAAPPPTSRVGGTTGVPRPGIDDAVAAVEREHLTEALAAADGNVTRAARHLGLTRNALRYRLRKYGLPVPPAEATVTPAPPARLVTAVARWERPSLGPAARDAGRHPRCRPPPTRHAR